MKSRSEFKKPNYREIQCKGCGKVFRPRTNIDKYCDVCKDERRRDNINKDPWRGIQVETSRGQAVRNTPMAIDLDRAVAKRVEKMK